MQPTGADDWVRRTVEAVEFVSHHNWMLLTSVGMPTWDIVTTLGVMANLPMIICAPVPLGLDDKVVMGSWRDQFGWNDEIVFPAPVIMVQGGPKATEMACSLRDHALIYEADVILPVSLRRGGNLQTMLIESKRPSARVDDRFAIPYTRSPKSVGYTIERHTLNPDLNKFENSWLIHWTRASNTAWPTERLCDFYHDIINTNDYPRSAYHTLRNILARKRIIASGRHMPSGEPCVSLSSLSPEQAVDLMRWRSRYRQMSFEPYGVAVPRELSERLNIAPVAYYDGRLPKDVSEADRWRWQSAGKIGDWTAEHEFRHRGDIDLSQIAKESLRVITRTQNEATAIEKEFGLESISMTVDA